MPIKLTVTLKEKRSTSYVYELDQREILIGRAPHCHVQLPFTFISSHHLTIIAEGTGYLIADNDATNKTTLNEKLLPQHGFAPLQDGDELELTSVHIAVALIPSFGLGRSLEESSEHVRHMLWRTLDSTGEETGVALEVIEGPDAGQRLSIPESHRRVTIGRAQGCDLPLTDPQCHERHLALERIGPGLSASPLNDQITRLDGEVLLSTRPLNHESRLQLGANTLRFIDPLKRHLDQLNPSASSRPEPSQPTKRLDEFMNLERQLIASSTARELGPPDRPPVLQKPHLPPAGEDSLPVRLNTSEDSAWGLFESLALILIIALLAGGLVIALVLLNVI